MKFTLKNILIIIVVVFLAVISVLPLFAAEPPFSDESYWLGLCSGATYNDNQKKCDEFRNYYNDKIDKANSDLKQKNFELSEVRKDAAKYNQMYLDINKEILEIEKQIVAIKSGIKKTEAYIAQLERDILKQEAEVAEKEERVKDYIAGSQSQTYTNTFIEFIMGAKDFSEIISRMQGMSRIKEYNDEIIIQLNIEKQEIEDNKSLAVKSVDLMKADEQIASKKADELELKATEASNLFKTFSVLVDDIEAQSNKISQEVKLSQEQIKNIGYIESSSSWFHPLGKNKGAYYNTNWGFKYTPGPPLYGQFHSGADFGPGGLPIYAPGNGVVVVSGKNNCGSGGLGNSCGDGWGNYVTMVVDIDGEIFGVSLAHMLNGSITVNTLDNISAGQRIGTVGNSGSSTSAHLHAEVYRLQETSIAEAVANFKHRRFGTGDGVNGTRLCHKGASAPCRVDAPYIWGDKTVGPGYYYGG